MKLIDLLMLVLCCDELVKVKEEEDEDGDDSAREVDHDDDDGPAPWLLVQDDTER